VGTSDGLVQVAAATAGRYANYAGSAFNAFGNDFFIRGRTAGKDLYFGVADAGAALRYPIRLDADTAGASVHLVNGVTGTVGIGVTPETEAILKLPEATGYAYGIRLGTDTSGTLIYDDGAGTVYASKGTSGPYFKSRDNIYASLGDNAGAKEIQLIDSNNAHRGGWDSDGNFETSGTAQIQGNLILTGNQTTTGTAKIIGLTTLQGDVVTSGKTPTVTGGVDVSSASIVGDRAGGTVTLTMDSNAVNNTGPDGTLFSVSWSSAYSSYPSSCSYVLSPGNDSAALVLSTVGYYLTTTTSGFTVKLHEGSVGSIVASDELVFHYVGVGR
jgi:hypothetical protein